jgi:carbamoyl-phosphate synthase large subunit
MKRVDTCAAEFDAKTPYMYSCYDGNDESEPTNNKKVLILGGGPNRIGQVRILSFSFSLSLSSC